MTVQILHGDCRQVLATLPDNSVHCVVTSPPYWGLRDYGVDGQIGLEDSVESWISEMVAVFREVRRVLRDDGTLWLNLGDSYAGSRQGPQGADSTLAGNGHQGGGPKRHAVPRPMTPSARRDDHPVPRSDLRVAGLKPKDLIGQPWRVAFALQADGWWLRQDIVWSKPNPMPESVRDRCTKAHEYVFLLSKSDRYYYDFDAMQEPVSTNTHARLSQDVEAQAGSLRAHGGNQRSGRPMKSVSRKYSGTGVGFGRGYDAIQKPRVKAAGDFDSALAVMPSTRNRRSVWTIPTEPFKGAHFATFPPALIEPCIAAGCPPGGMVLDPFGGAGTTALVADRLGRDATLIELNPAYIAIAEQRLAADKWNAGQRTANLFATAE